MESVTSKINEVTSRLNDVTSDVTSRLSSATNDVASRLNDVTSGAPAVVASAPAAVASVPAAVASVPAAVASVPAAVASVPAAAASALAVPSSYSWLKYVAVIIVLAFIGVNVFKMMGDATDTTTSILRPVLSLFGRTSGDLIKQTSDVAARGTKGVITATNTGVNSAVDVLKGDMERGGPPPPPPPKPDKRRRKGGFCYVGEEDGFRSCVEVNKADQCMSGDIFPTREICIHPQLRM